MKSIETHARTFLPLNISAVSSVSSDPTFLTVGQQFWKQNIIFEDGTKMKHVLRFGNILRFSHL